MQGDQSPQIYPATLRKELGVTAQMNLTELSYSLQLMSDKLPSISMAFRDERNASLKARGLFMAIAFEAGRRFGVQQAMGVVDPNLKRRIQGLLEED